MYEILNLHVASFDQGVVIGLCRLYHIHLRQRLERKLFPVPVFADDIELVSLRLEFNKHHLELFGRNNLLLNQGFGEVVEEGTVLRKDLLRLEVRVVDQALNLLIDSAHDLASPLSTLLSHGATHERSAGVRGRKSDGSNLLTHAPLLHHALSDVGYFLDVVGSAGGDTILTENYLLGEAASKGYNKLSLEVLPAVHARLKTRLLGSKESKSASSVGAGDDSDLLDLIVIGYEGTDDAVAGLVVGDEIVLLGGESGRASLLLKTDHDAVDGAIDLFPANGRLLKAGSGDGSLVHEILELGTGEAWGTAGNGLEVNIGLEGLATGVDAKDALATFEVGEINGDLAIEATGTEEGLVQYVNAVGGSDGYDTGVSVEAVHFYENLVNSLLALVVSARKAGATLTTDSVDLIDEDDAGGILLGLAKNVTHAGCANADEHFDELRSGDRDEGDASLAGHGLGEKGLSSSGGTVKDDTAGDAAAVGGVHLRLLKEVNDFGKLEFGAVASCDIVKVDASVGNHLDLSLGLAESHGVAWATTHAAGAASTAGVAGEEEETSEQDGGEDKGLGELSKST